MNRVVMVLALALSGCATSYPNHLTDDLTPIESDNYIRIDERIEYSERSGNFGGVDVLYVLNAGIYRPEFQNSHGTFYRGPESCVNQTIHRTEQGPLEGGIWIPKDRVNNAPRLYMYFNYDKEQARQAGGLVISAILESSRGEVRVWPPISDKEFIDKLVISNIEP